MVRFQQPIKNFGWTSRPLRQPPPLWKSWESPRSATFRPQDNSPFIKDDGSIIVPWESPNAALFLGGRWWHWEGVGPVDIHKSKIIWNSLQNGLEDSPDRGWLIGFLNHYQYVFVCFLCSKKLRMIPVFRGCFYPRPRSQSGQNRGSMSGLCLGNQCTWITTTFAYFIKVTGKESMAWKYSVRPRNLTWNPKMKVWKMRFLFKWVSFRFHVSFPECNGCLSNPYSKLPWTILMIQNDICDALPGMSQVKSSAGVTTRALGCDFSHVVFLDGGFKYVFIFTPIWGRFPFWPIFFQRGWNHQPDFHDAYSPPKLEEIPILLVGLLELLFPAKNWQIHSPSLTCNLKISAFQKEALIPKCHFLGSIMLNWVVVSNIFYFHPENWGRWFPIWLIFFNGVGSTTNQ